MLVSQLYFLLIKLNLIGPSLIIILDQEICRILPYYTSDHSNDYYGRSLRFYMGETKMGTRASQYFCSASAITQLRAGSRYNDVKQTAYLLVSIWCVLKLQQPYGFQPLPNQMHIPHVESANNLLFGKPKVDTFSSQRFNTELVGWRRERVELFIDINEKYQKFLLTKNPNVICDQKQFEELCMEKKTGMIDRGSIDEGLGILEVEGQEYISNATRPEPNEVDVDFEIQGPGPYDVADVKTLINWDKGNENLDVAAERMGGKIVKQRSRMRGLGKMPLHMIDLRKLSLVQRMNYQQTVTNTIRHLKHLVFVNGKTKFNKN